MNFYEQLLEQTRIPREYLHNSPIIVRVFDGRVNTSEYIAFLTEAYYHVSHTVPLLMAVGARLDMEQEWLRRAMAKYIEEETGHQDWILNDITTAGGDADSVKNGRPILATELMISYAYDSIYRVNPVCLLGMILVLEGTSVTLADKAANKIRQQTGLPEQAFTYLKTHGELDLQHMEFFKSVINKISQKSDQADIIHATNVFYRLYATIFRSLG